MCYTRGMKKSIELHRRSDNHYQIVFLHQPISKTRPRAFSRGGLVTIVDPQLSIIRPIKSALIEVAHEHNLPCTALPVDVSIKFFFEWPASMPKKLRCNAVPVTQRRDVDNLAKTYLDIGNEVLWCDDRQVIRLEAIKAYDDEARVEMSVKTFFWCDQ